MNFRGTLVARTFVPLLVVLTLCVVIPPGDVLAQETVPPAFLLWPLGHRGDMDDGQILAVSVLVANELERAGGGVLRAESLSPRPECAESDVDCMIRVAEKSGARILVYGDLSRVGSSWLLSLFAVDIPLDGSEARTSSRSFRSLGLMQDGMASMVAGLTKKTAVKHTVPSPVHRDPSSLTRHRITISPTAVGIGRGDFTMTGYALGVWELQYGVSDYVQVGAVTFLPVGIVGLMPLVSAHYRVNDNFAVGGGIYAGIVGSFANMRILDDAFIVLYGGSFQMTGIWGKHSLNFSLVAGSGTGKLAYDLGDAEGDVDTITSMDGAYMLPSIGYRYEIDPFWSFQVEVAIPTWAGPSMSMDADQVVAMIFYGVRGHAGLVYGDLGFMMPACESYFSYLWKFTPLGIPYFSLGFAF